MSKIALALVVHAHQPVGNFDHGFEEACQKVYSPFVQALLRHPRIRIGLHFSGCLLEWIEKHQPDLMGTDSSSNDAKRLCLNSSGVSARFRSIFELE